MKKELYSKEDVINYIWQYSNYHGNLLSYCDNIAKEDNSNGFAALIFLFNLTENVFKTRTKNFDDSFQNVVSALKTQNIITEKEHDFLNAPNNSVRRLRNLLAHSNLSKYHLSFTEADKIIYYPLTENETCLKIYDMVSEILFNLMLKVVSDRLIVQFDIILDDTLDKIEIDIKEFSPKELLDFKGIETSTIPNWNKLSEIDRCMLAENASNVREVSEIFKGLKKYLKD